MPITEIPVACVQARAHDRDAFATNWPRLLEATARACRDGAKLAVLPEGSVPGYVLGDSAVDAELLQRAASDLAHIARTYDATIVYGAAKIVDGRIFNAAIAVGPHGGELGFAAKQFLWHFDRRWFFAGATLAPIDTPLGKIGLLVCADGRIPSIAATLVDRGARMLVMPTAWVTSGRDPEALENIQADLMANVRARENGVPFVVANKCGVEVESVAYCGKSAIIDAHGNFIARASDRDEAIVAATVRLGDVAPRPIADAFAAPIVPADEPARSRVRIAFAYAGAADADRFARLAAQADADTLVTFGTASERDGASGGLLRIAVAPETVDAVCLTQGLRYATVSAATLRSPRGLVPARLAGVDLFIATAADTPTWNVRIARTRAAELRAFVLVFEADSGRAFAIDPDGVVVAGTFDGYRLATFVYDAARAHATAVAPRTDVLEGLRIAETIRAESSPSLDGTKVTA